MAFAKCNNKIKIKINTVANKYNYNDLESIYRIISKYNISRWKILVFWAVRKGQDNKKIFSLDDFQMKFVSEFVENKNKENKKIKIHFNNLNEFTTSYFSIFPDGSIENMLFEVVGNLLNDNLSDILNVKEKELVNHRLRKSIL